MRHIWSRKMMTLAIAPDFFSLQENPWYYIMGVVCL